MFDPVIVDNCPDIHQITAKSKLPRRVHRERRRMERLMKSI